MILIGQYDSPFVRRCAVAMGLYRLDYEHRPWAVFGDTEVLGEVSPLTEVLGEVSPLRRVPTLVLDDGEVLVESAAILDWLDELAGREQALIPPSGLGRRHALKVCALATGVADKAVSLVYERVVHGRATPLWAARCEQQIAGVFDELERDRTGRAWWGGEALGHADIAVACVLRFVREAHPQLFYADRWPALAAHSDACEAMTAFSAVSQPFHITPPEH